MPLTTRRRDLLAAGALAATAVFRPLPSHSYGYYAHDRVMRAPTLEEGESVWQWLLLLIDASSSMRQLFERMTFYDLQIEATARALMEPCVVERLLAGRSGRTAIGAILWSANRQQQIAVHWSVIRTEHDIAALATRLRNTANYLDSDTGVAAAIRFATEQMSAGYIARTSRRIIDMSANGRDNLGGDPSDASREAEQAGVTINAVVMRGYDGTVEEIHEYYESNVITRDGIIFKVEDEEGGLEALATASASKLCAEIALGPDRFLQAGIVSDHDAGQGGPER